MLPELHRQRNARIARQPAVEFRLRRIMQHINHARAANARWIIHARLVEAVVLAQLLRALLRKKLHVVLAAEVQAARGASLDARRLQPFADAVGAQRAFVYALGHAVQLRNIERAARDAIPAADAVILLEVDYAVGV